MKITLMCVNLGIILLINFGRRLMRPGLQYPSQVIPANASQQVHDVIRSTERDDRIVRTPALEDDLQDALLIPVLGHQSMREGRFILIGQCLFGDTGAFEHHVTIVERIDPAAKLDAIHRYSLAETDTAWSSHQVPSSCI